MSNKDFEELGIPAPTSDPHGTEQDIQKNMTRLMPTSWRQEGNQLIGETSMGRLVQTIPTNKILVGTDDKGLPIFRDIVIY